MTRVLVLLFLWPMLTHAAPDCSKLDSVDFGKTLDLDPKLMQECQALGWEPTAAQRLNSGQHSGIRAPGATGIAINSRAAPEESPGRKRAKSSVSNRLRGLSLSFPPWRGFPCQLPGGVDLCGNDSKSTSGDDAYSGYSSDAINNAESPACAISTDTSGTFGQTQPLGTNTSVPCGGSVGLSVYRLTLNPSPAGVFITNAGVPNAWTYRNAGTSFALAQNGTLPSYLCGNPKGSNAIAQKRFYLNAPVAQIIEYAAGAGYIAVRLQPDAGVEPDPFADPDPDDAANGVEPEKFLIVPLQNGIPRIPADCADLASYLQPVPYTNDAIIIESTAIACAGGPTLCAGQTSGAGTGSCESTTLTPTLASNPTLCTGQLQVVPLDRPTLVYPPGSTVQAVPIDGSPLSLAATANGSRLMVQSQAVLYFGPGSGNYLLPEGGSVKLDSGGQLLMNGPANFGPAGRAVTLPNGGTIQHADGTAEEIGAGASVAISAAYPLTVRLGRDIELPSGYLIPTQPTATVRLPVATTETGP